MRPWFRTYIPPGLSKVASTSPEYAPLYTALQRDLTDYGYQLQVVGHLPSYAVQDEVNKIIYLAQNRRGVPVDLDDQAWAGFHDLGHVIDGRTDEEYLQAFAPTLALERACDLYGLRRAISFFQQGGAHTRLRPDFAQSQRYSSPLHVAQWLENMYSRGSGFRLLRSEDLHHIADALGVPWDNDPHFMELCEETTGKAHLDDMDDEDLRKVVMQLTEEVIGHYQFMKEAADRPAEHKLELAGLGVLALPEILDLAHGLKTRTLNPVHAARSLTEIAGLGALAYFPAKHLLTAPKLPKPPKMPKVMFQQKLAEKSRVPDKEMALIRARFGQLGRQVSWARDVDGLFCYTHRARSNGYTSPSQVPAWAVQQISSSG